MNRLKYKVFDKRDNKLKDILGYTFSFEFPDLVHIQWANGTYECSIPLKDVVFCQCTGLKDKNGNFIYENDVVKVYRNHIFKDIEGRKYVVKFYKYEYWLWNGGYYPLRDFAYRANQNIEVIGNNLENK